MAERESMRVIDAALRSVQMSGVFYCPSVLTEPWGLALPPMDNCVWFHAVIRGSCTLEVGEEHCEARTGDLVLVPHGTGHRVRGEHAAATPPVFDLPHDQLSERYAVLRHGGGGARTDLVCGGIRFHHPAARYLVDALPPLIHVESATGSRADWLRFTLELLAEETRHVRAGNDAVISRVCDIVVMQAIRSWIENEPAAHLGWLGALRDQQIGTALALVHADPAREWTVASLADAVAMSRSAFASRFTSLVGEPAMKYVTRSRMYVALDLLQSTDKTVAAIAGLVGYDSEAAFSRAFARIIGDSPRAAGRRAGSSQG